MTNYIAFTGHRNKITDPSYLDRIAAHYPNAVWVQGEAKGFDSQVKAYALAHDIPVESHPPNYTRYGRGAPFVRNRAMVDRAEIVIACYDLRATGGTVYTMKYAKKTGKKVFVVPAFSPDSHVQNDER